MFKLNKTIIIMGYLCVSIFSFKTEIEKAETNLRLFHIQSTYLGIVNITVA